MKSKKHILGLTFAFTMLISIQLVKDNAEAQLGSYIASQITENTHAQRVSAGMSGAAGGMAGRAVGAVAGRWLGAKIGAGIGSAIAPGVGTVIGAGIGIL